MTVCRYESGCETDGTVEVRLTNYASATWLTTLCSRHATVVMRAIEVGTTHDRSKDRAGA